MSDLLYIHAFYTKNTAISFLSKIREKLLHCKSFLYFFSKINVASSSSSKYVALLHRITHFKAILKTQTNLNNFLRGAAEVLDFHTYIFVFLYYMQKFAEIIKLSLTLQLLILWKSFQRIQTLSWQKNPLLAPGGVVPYNLLNLHYIRNKMTHVSPLYVGRQRITSTSITLPKIHIQVMIEKKHFTHIKVLT